MKRSLAVLFGLNVLDMVTTLIVLGWADGIELNPIMAWAYSVSPSFFVATKLSILGLLSIPLYRGGEQYRSTVRLINWIYVGVVIWNSVGIAIHYAHAHYA